MSQVTTTTVQANTLTSGGTTVAIPKNVDVTGNINFTGQLLQNGQPFAAIPNQSPATAGSVLMSDGQNAFWANAVPNESVGAGAYWATQPTGPNTGGSLTTFSNEFGTYRSTPSTTTLAGGQNPTISSAYYLPYTGTGQWYDSTGALYNITVGSSFRYRSIFTHGFLIGGYRGSNPWRTVNQTFHATDITISRGDQLDRAASYVDGNFGDFNGYVFGTENAYGGSGASVSSINLHNGTNRTFGPNGSPGHGDAYSTTPDSLGASMDTWDSTDDPGSVSGFVTQRGYTAGGGPASIQRLNFITEMSTRLAGGFTNGNATGCEGETRGYLFGDNSNAVYVTFSSESVTSYTLTSWGTNDGWKKNLSSKWGHCYHGAGANVTLPWIKFNDLTATTIGSQYNQKDVASGEENMEEGQDWGYCLGNYGDAGGNYQNNRTWKRFYANDSDIVLGFKSEPKGHQGQSSGACVSGAFAVTGRRYQ